MTHQTSAVRSQAPGERQDWRHRAACRYEDPELFFLGDDDGPGREQAAEAKDVCRGCPVRRTCLDWAIRTGQVGIWGGMSEDGRRKRAESLRAHGRLPAKAAPTPVVIAEDKLTRTIRQLATTGLSDAEIGAQIGRSAKTVREIRKSANIPPGVPQGVSKRRAS